MTAQLPQQFTSSNLPTEVSVCEVSARDGLQSQARTLPVSTRLELIRRLSDAGLKTIEAGSFVSPRTVPQMADTRSVLAGLDLDSEIAFPVLVPNRRGLDDAVAAGTKDASVFISVTESFAQANLGVPFSTPPIAASRWHAQRPLRACGCAVICRWSSGTPGKAQSIPIASPRLRVASSMQDA